MKALRRFTPASIPAKRIVAVLVSAIALIAALLLVDLGAVAAAAGRLSATTILIVLLALTAGALLASARLACVAADVGYKMRASDAIAALSLGQLAGAIFFQLVGQLIARSAVLSRRGVPVSGTIFVTGYERLLALLVSAGFALAGAWFLFGHISLEINAGGATLLKLTASGLVALAFSAALAWGRPFAAFARAKIGPHAMLRLTRGVLLSLGIQLCTMIAYIAAVLNLAPDMGVLPVAAAAAVVMLAAAVPVSLAGWGVRELGAIYALGAIGVDRETSIVVAVLIGAAALAVVGGLAAATAVIKTDTRQSPAAPAAPAFDTGSMLAWGLPILAIVAVFFQIHVPLAASRLNVNLADPIALTAAAILIVDHVVARRWPAWRLPSFNLFLALMTACLILAFLNGWIRFGLTSWALTNRLAGWFILLAYLGAGSLIVRHGGDRGFELLLRGFAAAAIGIIVVDLAIFSLVRLGLPVPEEITAYRLEGFAQNPNAFALQLMFAVAAVIATVRSRRAQAAWLSMLFIGLWFTGSRAGFIALGVVALTAVWLRAVRISVLATAVVVTFAAAVCMDWLPEIVQAVATAVFWTIDTAYELAAKLAALLAAALGGSGGAGEADGVVAPRHLVLTPPKLTSLEIIASGYDSSNTQRIASLQGGFAMFLQHPVLGGGLGAFTAEYLRLHGVPLVIHSTPLWLLAELGIVGFLIFAAPFILLLKQKSPAGRPPAHVFTILLLLSFATVSVVHDIMYQRAFWLLLGAALAVCMKGASEEKPLR